LGKFESRRGKLSTHPHTKTERRGRENTKGNFGMKKGKRRRLGVANIRADS